MKTELEEILKTHGIGKYTVEQKTLHQNILNAMEEAVFKLGKSEVGKVPGEICKHEMTEKGSCVTCGSVKQTEEKPLSVERIEEIMILFDKEYIQKDGYIILKHHEIKQAAQSIYNEINPVKQEWISVIESLPSENDKINFTGLGHVMMGFYYKGHFRDCFNPHKKVTDITHWMPLPKSHEQLTTSSTVGK